MGIDPEAGAENVGTDEAFPDEPWDGGIKPVAITLLPELGCEKNNGKWTIAIRSRPQCTQ